jgi:hypothetical protein
MHALIHSSAGAQQASVLSASCATSNLILWHAPAHFLPQALVNGVTHKVEPTYDTQLAPLSASIHLREAPVRWGLGGRGNNQMQAWA